MKKREGYISNSSSTSFIVSSKNGKVKVVTEIDLEDFSDLVLDDKSNVEVELEKYYEMKPEAEKVEEIKSRIKNGEKVYLGRFSSDSDREFERYLYDSGLPENKKEYTILESGW